MIGDSFIMGRTNWWYLVTDLEVVGVSDFSDGDPLPSANALDWVDSRLVALLSNASVMNGSSLKPSIWSMLENIHRPSPTSSPTQVGSETLPFKEDEPAAASSPNVYPNQLSNDSFSDTSSIRVYSPLFPTQSDLVELAELVPFDTVSGEMW